MCIKQAVRVATRYAPAPPAVRTLRPTSSPYYTPYASAPSHGLLKHGPARLTPWIFVIDRQRLALGGGVETGLVDIHYIVTWTANQSGLVTLTFDFLTLKVVSESRVTRVTSVPILVFLGISVLDLGPMYATDRQTRRQTDRRQTKASLNAQPIRGGGIINECINLLPGPTICCL